MDPVRHGFRQEFKHFSSSWPVGLVDRLSNYEVARAIDVVGPVETAFGSLNLGDIHMEEASRVALEALAGRLTLSMFSRREVPCHCRQACSIDRIRCGIESRSASRQSSSGSNV